MLPNHKCIPGKACALCRRGTPKPSPTPAITIGEPPALTPTKPRVVCTVAVGEKGAAMLKATEPAMRAYAAKVGADFVAITGTPLNPGYPLGDKFRLHHLTPHWQRLLFIDADAVVHQDAPDLFDQVPETHVAIFDDAPHVPSIEYHRKAFRDTVASQGIPMPNGCESHVLNSGIVLWAKSHAEMWAPPPKPLPKSMHVGEQNWVQLNLLRHGYPWVSLGREWNHQWWSDRRFTEALETRPWVLHMAGMGQSAEVPGWDMPPDAVRQIALASASWATGCGCRKKQRRAVR